MPTAQETYNEMLKTALAPGLRSIGFKGSGQNYRLPSDEYWAMFGRQAANPEVPFEAAAAMAQT